MGCDTNNRVIGEFEKLIEKHITEGDSREHSGDYVNAAVDFETALLYLTQVFKLCSDENTKHRISMLYNQLAHAHALSGNAELALVFYGKSLSLRKEMYGDNPSAENCLDVSFCYDRIARMYEKQDRFSEAVLSFGQSFRWVRRAKGMIAENEFEHIRCSVLNRIANVLAETGKYRSALIKYEKSYNICKRMYEENPSGQTAHDLFVCVFNIAELMRMCGDCVDSYIWFCYGKELLEKNLGDRGDLAALKDFAYCYMRMAAAAGDLGDYEIAMSYCRRSIELHAVQAEQDSNIKTKRHYAAALNGAGDICFSFEDYSEALKLYQKSLDYKTDIGKTTSSFELDRDTAVSFCLLGDVKLALNMKEEAEICYRNAVQCDEKRSLGRVSDNTLSDLAYSYYRLYLSNKAENKEYCEKAKQITEYLNLVAPLNAGYAALKRMTEE